jgi:protein TonB
MQSILHSMNIGTLATWLSVAGFGAVGVVVPEWHPAPAAPVPDESRVFEDDFTLGDAGSAATEGNVVESQLAPEVPESMEMPPAPPDLAPLAEWAPLPEVPELPAPALVPSPRSNLDEAIARSRRASSSGVKPSFNRAKTAATRSSGGMVAADASASAADRLAGGRMPAPSYPAECRRKGQSGTVLVEFTVDTSGRVISAHAKSASPWPLLNEEAVRTVRRWKFPPGGVMKLQRPIVFQLR